MSFPSKSDIRNHYFNNDSKFTDPKHQCATSLTPTAKEEVGILSKVHDTIWWAGVYNLAQDLVGFFSDFISKDKLNKDIDQLKETKKEHEEAIKALNIAIETNKINLDKVMEECEVLIKENANFKLPSNNSYISFFKDIINEIGILRENKMSLGEAMQHTIANKLGINQQGLGVLQELTTGFTKIYAASHIMKQKTVQEKKKKNNTKIILALIGAMLLIVTAVVFRSVIESYLNADKLKIGFTSIVGSVISLNKIMEEKSRRNALKSEVKKLNSQRSNLELENLHLKEEIKNWENYKKELKRQSIEKKHNVNSPILTEGITNQVADQARNVTGYVASTAASTAIKAIPVVTKFIGGSILPVLGITAGVAIVGAHIYWLFKRKPSPEGVKDNKDIQTNEQLTKPQVNLIDCLDEAKVVLKEGSIVKNMATRMAFAHNPYMNLHKNPNITLPLKILENNNQISI